MVTVPSAFRTMLARVSPALHIARVTWAFSAVANLWLVVLWTRSVPLEPACADLASRPLWLLLVSAAAVALGLFFFGTAVNDIADMRRDRIVKPDRPLASGAASVELGLSIMTISLLASLLGALAFGTAAVVLAASIALVVLAFNLVFRFVPGVGLLALACAHALSMLVPNQRLAFVWPVWLVLTHVLATACVQHIVAQKVPVLSRRALLFVVFGWALASACIGWLGAHNAGAKDLGSLLLASDARWTALLAPMLVAIVFPLVVKRKIARYGLTQRCADKIGRYGSVWLAVYACAWLLGQGLADPALILGALALIGVLGMTTLREMYSFMEQPAGFRR